LGGRVTRWNNEAICLFAYRGWIPWEGRKRKKKKNVQKGKTTPKDAIILEDKKGDQTSRDSDWWIRNRL